MEEVAKKKIQVDVTKPKSKVGLFKRKMPISVVGKSVGTTFVEDKMVYVLKAFQPCLPQNPTARNLSKGNKHVRTRHTL